MSLIVGISAHYHDAACAIFRDGRLIAAAEEERFSRRKHDADTPIHAFRYCLDAAGADICDIDRIAYYEEPSRKLARQLWMGLPDLPSRQPRAFSRLDPTRPIAAIRERLGFDGPIECVGHHLSHAAASYHFSGFEEAAVLVVDGVGEIATTSYGRGSASDIAFFEDTRFPHSLGLLYSAITAYLGFDVNDGEYKTMGLAPYGKPRFLEKLRNLVDVGDDGQFVLDLTYFDFISGNSMFSPALRQLLGFAPREAESELTQDACDLAASMQTLLEEILLQKVRYLHKRTGCGDLCLGGGVALNCVANGKILRDGPFDRLFVFPAAGDAGSAVGAAAALIYRDGQAPRRALEHVYLGPDFSDARIGEIFETAQVQPMDFRGREDALFDFVAEQLAAGKIIGWFQGRMEFGPRALGNRSILADPRNERAREYVNVAVKKRETFRPFAPAVLWEKAADHFDLDRPSPFMLETCSVTSSIALPAVTHVDGSARVQTVHAETNPRFHALLGAFERKTGCPVLLNTSFNMRGDPIVCSPFDAIECFMRSDLDFLVLGNFVMTKTDAPAAWRTWFERAPSRHARTRDNIYSLL